jgi:hypothetical protein
MHCEPKRLRCHRKTEQNLAGNRIQNELVYLTIVKKFLQLSDVLESGKDQKTLAEARGCGPISEARKIEWLSCLWLAQCIVYGIYQILTIKLDIIQSIINFKLNFLYQLCSIFSTNCINYAPPTPPFVNPLGFGR